MRGVVTRKQQRAQHSWRARFVWTHHCCKHKAKPVKLITCSNVWILVLQVHVTVWIQSTGTAPACRYSIHTVCTVCHTGSVFTSPNMFSHPMMMFMGTGSCMLSNYVAAVLMLWESLPFSEWSSSGTKLKVKIIHITLAANVCAQTSPAHR